MEHLTESQLSGYVKRTLPPAELLTAGEHLRDCEHCRQRSWDAGAVALPEWTLSRIGVAHLTYEELEARIDRRDDDNERARVGEHLGFCTSCRAEYEDLRQFRESLQPARQQPASVPRERFRIFWLRPQIAIAALLLVTAAALSWWYLRREATSPARAHLPQSSPAQHAPNVPTPGNTKLELLARVVPPQYRPSTVRGDSGEAQRRFHQAMESYLAHDYSAALTALEAASRLDPNAAGPIFYSGVCQLLTGQRDQAVLSFQRVNSMGESPYLEKSYFYLAKAQLQKEDVDGAITALESTVRLRGDFEAEARQLILQIREAVQSKP